MAMTQNEQMTPRECAVELCRELYDRFMMGGWLPEDAHAEAEALIRRTQPQWISVEKELPKKSYTSSASRRSAMNIDDVISAFEDLAEARAELKQMQAEYTGYSPSYHLSSWIEAESKARAKMDDTLRAYIHEAINGGAR